MINKSHVKTQQMYLTVYNMHKLMMHIFEQNSVLHQAKMRDRRERGIGGNRLELKREITREEAIWRDPFRVVLVVQTSIPNLHSCKKFQNSAIDT